MSTRLILTFVFVAWVSCVGAAEAERAIQTMETNSGSAWGLPVNGLRLAITTDRAWYRLDRDLVNVTFIIQNVTDGIYPVTLALTAEERTDLVVTDAEGNSHVVAGAQGPRLATKVRHVELGPRKVASVNMLLDPATVAGGLPAGQYRLQGDFRYAGPRSASWIAEPFTLHSESVSLVLRDEAEEHVGGWPAGPADGGCSLTLLADRDTWKPGDPPLPFRVVLNRLEEGPDAFRLLSVCGLTYYRLDVTDPNGKKLVVPQPAALPSSVSPHFRFAEVAAGKSVGEALFWDPGGVAVERTTNLDDLFLSSGPAAPVPGKYEVRAVYQVDADAEAKSHYGIKPDRLESNSVEVQVEERANNLHQPR